MFSVAARSIFRDGESGGGGRTYICKDGTLRAVFVNLHEEDMMAIWFL